MKKETLRMVPDIVFFAALWGIVEATLGYALHWIPGPLISGSILFPFATLILIQAYKRLESRKALFAIGVLAALIKSVNLLMPNLNQFKVINPMIAIVLETAVVTAVVFVIVSKRFPLQLSAFIGASLGWRALFLAWQGSIFLVSGFEAPNISSVGNAAQFTVFQGILSAGFAIGLYYGFEALRRKTDLQLRMRPLTAGILFALALMITPLIEMI